ncbi:hypothetical protein AYO45_05925 [Gammaproteobacteria bacterium SCGC AG-212-F23]|nr:hypothetical protein AYO45_05925 [Gammaproteobacteria bacterium SCGC AG-212-F23]
METGYIKNMLHNAEEISWHTLYHADRNISAPFHLSLSDTDKHFVAEKVIRIIPGKRLVAYGMFGNQPVVAKLFYERRKASRHALRDTLGVDALISSSVPTPKLIYKGTAKQQRIQILIFERILNANTLEEIWQKKSDSEEITPLLHAIILELATQHVLGILQRDLHFKNFLIANNKIYTLDGSDIKKLHDRLSKKESLDHLALFFSQLGVGHELLRESLLTTYINARGWNLQYSEIHFLNQAYAKHQKKRWERFQKKITRSCSTYFCKNSANDLVIFNREYQSNSLIEFFQHPDAIFQSSQTEILKDGRSSTVVKTHFDHHSFVVKRYNIKNIWHWLRRRFRPTRAAKSWRLSHYLYLMGIATAKPIALIEKKFWGLSQHSYFLMEHVPGIHIGEYFSLYDKNNPAFSEIAKKIIELFKHLASIGLSHNDLKMTNILISHHKPIIIDLDGMREHRSPTSAMKRMKKDIVRFMRNWENNQSVHQLFENIIGETSWKT